MRNARFYVDRRSRIFVSTVILNGFSIRGNAYLLMRLDNLGIIFDTNIRSCQCLLGLSLDDNAAT